MFVFAILGLHPAQNLAKYGTIKGAFAKDGHMAYVLPQPSNRRFRLIHSDYVFDA